MWVCALFVLAAAAPRSAAASAISDWNFLIDRVPSWQAAGDIGALSRTPDGMVVVPSGPTPTLVAPAVAFASEEAVYVRFRVRSPKAIDGAYLGWASVDPSGRETNSGVTFTIPREIRGGGFRTVWVRVADSSTWSGEIRRLGLALPVDEGGGPITIQSVELVAPGLWALARVAWAGMGVDILSAWMVSQGSMMSLGYVPRTDESFRYPAVPRATWTLHGYAGFAVLLGLALLGVARWTRASERARMIAGAGFGAIVIVIGLLAVLSMAVDMSVWRVERSLFGGRTPAESYTAVDGVNLMAVTEDLRGILPHGAAVAACLSGERWNDEAWFWPVRYHSYPIPVEPEGPRTFPTGEARYRDHYLLVFSNSPATCTASQRALFVRRPLYSLYRPL